MPQQKLSTQYFSYFGWNLSMSYPDWWPLVTGAGFSNVGSRSGWVFSLMPYSADWRLEVKP